MDRSAEFPSAYGQRPTKIGDSFQAPFFPMFAAASPILKFLRALKLW